MSSSRSAIRPEHWITRRISSVPVESLTDLKTCSTSIRGWAVLCDMEDGKTMQDKLRAMRRRRHFISAGLAFGLLGTWTATSAWADRKSTRLNSSHSQISYAVFCLKKKKNTNIDHSAQSGV